MADISDVTAYLAQTAASAVYPNGMSQPSVAAMDCRIFEGWPIPDQLDLDMQGLRLSGSPPTPVKRSGGPVANVSVFPMPGTGVTVSQQLEQTYVIAPPVFGLAVSVVTNGDITLTGTPTAGEYLTVITDRAHAYSRGGVSAAAILAALAADVSANYPDVVVTGSTLSIPGAFAMVVRQGAVATLGKVTHRQRHPVMVTVWAPTQAARTLLAEDIDNVIKQKVRITLPDTSQALVIYSRTLVSDERQATTIYRRDLIYDVEYATLQLFPGYVVTSAAITIHKSAPDPGTDASAIT